MTLKQFIDALAQGEILYRDDGWAKELIFMNKHSTLFHIEIGHNFVLSEKNISKILEKISGKHKRYRALTSEEAGEIMKQWLIKITDKGE